MSSQSTPHGSLGVRRIGLPLYPTVATVRDAVAAQGGSWLWRRRNASHFDRSLGDMAKYEQGRLPLLGQLWLRKICYDGHVADYGLVSCRVVTTAGVNFLVDALQGLVEPEAMRYHGFGVGSTAESSGQTQLSNELGSTYSTSNTRPTGTLGEQSGNPNVFESVATVTVSGAATLTEHGIFSQAAVPGGTMLDRSVFAGVALASGESMQATYRLTIPAGS
jgi:hypothetical protein